MNIPSWCEHYVSLSYDQVNCWGLVRLVYKEIYGVELLEVHEQGELITDGFWRLVPENENKQTSDVLLFKDSKIDRHVGILLNDHYMLHADRNCGTVIERWGARTWVPRLRGVYRCKLLS